MDKRREITELSELGRTVVAQMKQVSNMRGPIMNVGRYGLAFCDVSDKIALATSALIAAQGELVVLLGTRIEEIQSGKDT